ncbi:MAG: YybH family protein [Ignavibacteria bacterium]
MEQLAQTILKTASAILLITFLISTGCQQQTGDTKTAAAFDKEKAKSLIDSINTKFIEEFRNGDSVALGSHYWPDAELFFPTGEPIKGKDIISGWGSTINMGLRDITLTTTDIMGDENFIIETGIVEFRDGKKSLVDKGNYVVVWQQRNGEWKLYRDIGNSSMPPAK